MMYKCFSCAYSFAESQCKLRIVFHFHYYGVNFWDDGAQGRCICGMLGGEEVLLLKKKTKKQKKTPKS